jgi:glycosyltransferase involved in cell wall biosynthesis
MGAVQLSVLFPAYNEAAAIREVVLEAEESLRPSGLTYELVVLDDASRDDTWGILEELARNVRSLRVLRHERNQGIAASLHDLFQAAQGELLFHNGSDGQWKTAEVLRMFPLMRDHDIVVGKRKHKHYGWWRRLVSSLYNALPVLLFGVRTHDAGSIKLFPRKLLGELTLTSRGLFREAERLIRASRRGYRIGVIDVESYPRRSGKASGARPALVLGALKDLARCWWRIVVCRER